MHPILFRFGSVTIYSFGASLAACLLVGSFLIWKQTRKWGLPEEGIFDLLSLGTFFAIAGGRLGYVFLNWATFAPDWPRIFLVLRYPGVSFEGSLGSGVLALIFGAAALKLPLLRVLDIFALGFAWAMIAGFGGCYLDGCVRNFPQLPLVLAGGQLIVALVLTWLARKINSSIKYAELARRPGLTASAYLIFVSISFLILEGITKRGLGFFYGCLLIISTAFLVGRYGKAAQMIKFPTDVLQQMRDYLEKRNADIEHKLKDLKKEDPFEDKSRLLDRASEDTEAQSKAGHERVAAMQQQLRLALVQTRKALTKIKIGNYGVCESCGKMIDTDRLAAMPTATFCLACEKKRER